MIKFIIEYAVLKIKKRELILDDAVTDGYLLSLCFRQFFSFLRGFVLFRKFVSVGQSTSIICKSKIDIASGVSIGTNVVIDALGQDGLKIGSGTSIASFSIIKVSGSLTSLGKGVCVGANVGIGEFAHIGGAGGVTIGDNTIVGAYFSIHPENHNFSDKEKLIRLQGVTQKGIKVGENCWIGAKVTLLDGCEIGDGCVVAAGAVVKGKFPNNVVIGGVPARVLREREND